jgi:predicted nucleic acid-binding protein
MNKIFVDSNIILYLMDNNIHKRSISEDILLQKPFISAQVLTEVANVCKRRFKYEKEDILNLWRDLMSDCDFIATTKTTFDNGIELVKKYKFQLFDALIIASALEANCNILYSEDMQHKMVVEGKLTIINPFI